VARVTSASASKWALSALARACATAICRFWSACASSASPAFCACQTEYIGQPTIPVPTVSTTATAMPTMAPGLMKGTLLSLMPPDSQPGLTHRLGSLPARFCHGL